MSHPPTSRKLWLAIAGGGLVASLACGGKDEIAPLQEDGNGGSTADANGGAAGAPGGAGSASTGSNGGSAGSNAFGNGGSGSGGAGGADSGNGGSEAGGAGGDAAGGGGSDGGAAGTQSGGTGGSASAGASGASGSGGTGSTEPFEYRLIDFAGDSTGREVRTIADWDIRERFTFDVVGDHTTSATVEVVNSQATLSFSQQDPEPFEGGDVFQLVKIPSGAGDGANWGGWAHVIFDLGGPISTDIIVDLPQWDDGAGDLAPGSKVIQLDVYYDDTVDPNFDWNKLLDLEKGNNDVWNADPSQGYSINLHLVNYANHANFEGAQDAGGGTYIGYTAYLTAPNEWVTLTFDAPDYGRSSHFYAAGNELAALPNEITGIDVKPAGGYDPADENPLYVRNLRIVDAP